LQTAGRSPGAATRPPQGSFRYDACLPPEAGPSTLSNGKEILDLKTTLTRLALALLLCGGTASAAKAGGMFPYKTHVETLDNGLEVVLVPMSSQGLVAYWSMSARSPRRVREAHWLRALLNT
jgi:hypothetical protein